MSAIQYNRAMNLARLKNWNLILETHKLNVQYKLDRKISSIQHNEWNNTRDVEFVIRHDLYPELLVKEDATYVPRFSIKQFSHPLFAQFPPNKELKYDKDLMATAIKYGMILMVQYRGDKDGFVQGHQRVIYPMVLGTSAKGKPLLRGYHLRGWSVSKNGNIDKDWRMFRTDRILSMSFTGSFFRLPPEGYKMNDKGMVGGITAAADFDEIRKNQKSLIQKEVIQNKREVVIDEKKKIVAIQVDNTNSKLDLSKPFENPNINEDDKKILRLTFLKSVNSNAHVCIVGALGQKGHLVKLTSRGKYLGTFRVLKSVMGDHLNKPHLRQVNGKSEFDLYVFIKKLDGSGTSVQKTETETEAFVKEEPKEQRNDVQGEPYVAPTETKPESEVKKEVEPEVHKKSNTPKFLDLMNKVAQVNKKIPK